MLKIVGLLVIAAILSVAAFAVYRFAPKIGAPLPQVVISTFDECAAAGNPIMPARPNAFGHSGGESYPPQCMTKDGRTFTQDIPEWPEPAHEGIVANGCAVAGCSGQLCVSAEEASMIVTTCEYRAEYACYRKASCEPQADGKCGWTPTPVLKQCLANPPAMDSQLEVL